MNVINRERLFSIKQRIQELKKAILRSPSLARQAELKDLQTIIALVDDEED